MGWEWAIKQERWKLKRFIVLLFALSAIASRASNAPGPLRRLLLSILLSAAPVAMNYVEADGPVSFDTDDGAADLEFLSALFRTAAQALTVWLNCAPNHAGVTAELVSQASTLIPKGGTLIQALDRGSSVIAGGTYPRLDTS